MQVEVSVSTAEEIFHAPIHKFIEPENSDSTKDYVIKFTGKLTIPEEISPFVDIVVATI